MNRVERARRVSGCSERALRRSLVEALQALTWIARDSGAATAWRVKEEARVAVHQISTWLRRSDGARRAAETKRQRKGAKR